ncbi:MAG TPA: amidohydrolase [Blastocatellia bacterium]|nr:amidohydrolase [Blastocatellia bacterium]
MALKLESITSLSEADVGRLVADRRSFHRYPELGYNEQRTARSIADRLSESAYQVTTGVGRSGVVGLLEGAQQAPEAGSAGASPRGLLYRADMDALPIKEENDVDYRSQNEGVMHACGHDAHVAIALAVATRIAAERERLRGSLKFAFQPAEEGGNGAMAMIEDGVLEDPKVTAAVGLHVWNNLPVGQVGVYTGALMAAVDEFELTVQGVGGHGAMPQQTVDAIVTAAQIVTSLQTVVSRNVAPLDSAVVTVGKFIAGTAFNIIADTATLRGTVRTFNKDIHRTIPEMVERVIRGVCESMGATYKLDYIRQSSPLVNNSEMCQLVAECAAEVVGTANVIRDESVRTMGGEDMAYFLERVPGCYFFLGTRNEARGLIHPHHSPRFDIDESALPIGVEIMSRVVRRYLS